MTDEPVQPTPPAEPAPTPEDVAAQVGDRVREAIGRGSFGILGGYANLGRPWDLKP
jgi:hypothetical protein